MKIIPGLKNSLKHDMRIAGIKMYVPIELPLQPSELKLLPNAIAPVAGLVILCFLLIAGCAQVASASNIPDDKAVLAIIGEAENQGYDGMKAVACGIRNRGTLKGVYGLNAPRVKQHKYSEDTEAKAIVAWQNSSDPQECLFLGGADHWENVNAFGKPSWAKDMVVTYTYKDHVFYRRK